MKEGTCSALLMRGREERCTNGFPTSAGCHPIVGAVPFCLKEWFCARLYPETGKPEWCQPFTSTVRGKSK